MAVSKPRRNHYSNGKGGKAYNIFQIDASHVLDNANVGIIFIIKKFFLGIFFLIFVDEVPFEAEFFALEIVGFLYQTIEETYYYCQKQYAKHNAKYYFQHKKIEMKGAKRCRDDYAQQPQQG